VAFFNAAIDTDTIADVHSALVTDADMATIAVRAPFPAALVDKGYAYFTKGGNTGTTWTSEINGRSATSSGQASVMAGGSTFFSGGHYTTDFTVGNIRGGKAAGYAVAAYVKFTGSTSQVYSAIVGGQGGPTEFFIGKGHGSTCLGVQDNQYVACVQSDSNAFDGTYHSVIFSQAGNGVGKMFVDGVFVGSASFSGGSGVDNEVITIGKEVEGPGYPWTGNIDEVAFFDAPLSDSDVSDMHVFMVSNAQSVATSSSGSATSATCTSANSAPGIYAYYKAGTNTGSTWPSAVNSHTSSRSGSATPSGDQTVFSGGHYTTDFTVGDLRGSTGYTVAAYVKFTGSAGQTYSAITGGQGGPTEFFIGKGSGSTCLGVQDNQYHACIQSDSNAFDGRYHSVIFSEEANGVGKMYVDGAYVGQQTFSAFSDVNGETVIIGKEVEGSGYGWAGNIDDIAYFQNPLSAAQVAVVHQRLATRQPLCY
jgi:hypothetical protein